VANVRVQKTGGAIGTGWDEEVQWSGFFPTYCLQPIKNHTVSVTFPDGKVYKFQAASTPQCQQFVPITAPQIGFTQISTGSATAGASLTPIGDTDLLLDGSIPGPTNIINFDVVPADYTQFQLKTAEGFTYILDQKLGATSVTDPNGNTLTINSSGVVSSTGTSVVFTRDTLGRITQIADPAGNILIYTYSGPGDLVGFADTVGNTTTYGYDPAHLLTDITDPRGIQAIRNTYDDPGRLISTVDANGNKTTFTHDVAANHETITDRLGNATLYEYDDDGNVVRKTDALGNVTTATFDANDNQLTRTDALGKTTSFTYDASGNPITVTDPLGHTTRITYNSRKQPITITDPMGRISTNTYDAKGNLLSTQDPLGNTTTYTNNAQGSPLSVKDPLGNITSFVYDAGRVFQQTDALGTSSNFTYDNNGNKLSQTITRTKSDGTRETLLTRYEYDGSNRLLRTTRPDGSILQTAYNAIGQQSDAIDALGHKTHYDYDNNGRLVKTTYPDGTTETSTYDANGNRLTSTDRENRVTSYSYDVLNRLIQTTYPDGATTQTVYDAVGRTIKTIDAAGNATQKAYDDAGRYISTTDALGHLTRFGYDAADNQSSITDALNHTTQFVYDAANRRVQIIHPDLTADSVAYDAAGRQISKTDQAGKITRYGYDALGRIVSVTDALGQVTQYSYDELGHRLTQTDANSHTTAFVYDQLGRRISRTLPLGMSESYSYDAAGNLISRKDFNGHTTTYTYDSLNRLTQKTADAFFSTAACAGGACGATQVSFSYSATGRRLSMSDASGTTNYMYDSRDRLLTKATPFGTLSYTYDAAGNTASLKSSNASGASMTYTYDALNRLASVADPSGTMAYGYDDVGNLQSYIYPNGVSTNHAYDALNRLTRLQSNCTISNAACPTPGTPLASYAYVLGTAGNRLSVAELSGRTVNYAYDGLYRLASETIAGDSHQNGVISYTYDLVGNRTQRNSTVPAVPATGLLDYDANDRISTDPYDSNGNLLNAGAGSNVYDFENHLVQAGGVKLVYDGDGNRVSETVASVATQYLVADQNLTGYAQVLDEIQNGVVVRTYSYGLVLINERQAINGAPTTSFYGYDGHGSVRFLTGSNGAITDTYDYDAFGNLISSSGSTPNIYLFAGQQFDPALGIYYNRARYYDERIGRFWSMDTDEGISAEPISLHKYLYASMDPVNRVDPSGKFDLVEFAVAGAIIGALAGGGLYSLLHKGEFSLQKFIFWTLTGAAIGAVVGVAVYQLGPVSLRWLGVSPGLVATWQEGEQFIEDTLQIEKNTATYIMNGTARIPDFIDEARAFMADAKFVANLSYTAQLRDYVAYALQNGYRFYIFCRTDTNVSQPLIDAVESTGGQIIRLLIK
jgi:RHS repeat-associated protein